MDSTPKFAMRRFHPPRSMAFRALLRGTRARLGSLLPSSAQLRQSPLRSDIDCRHSPSTETISNTMNAPPSKEHALAMGLGISIGHPLGIVVAAAMPFACSVGYYIAGLWPVVPGLARYTGQYSTTLIRSRFWS